jgi:AcrR family transcriptional regulator
VRTTTELRETILAAARSEFAQYGLAGARIDRIAKSAAASKERLYAHFTDKEALFRGVVAADMAEFFAAVTLRGDAVPEFVGDIYDLACRRPEHLRMMTWANLEGLALDPPPVEDGESIAARDIGVIKAAQAAGRWTQHGNPWTCWCCFSESGWPGLNRHIPMRWRPTQ